MVKKPEHLRDLRQPRALFGVIDSLRISPCRGGFDIAPQKLAKKVNCPLQVMAQPRAQEMVEDAVLIAGVCLLEPGPMQLRMEGPKFKSDTFDPICNVFHCLILACRFWGLDIGRSGKNNNKQLF
jgi:hypothetical protein